MHKLERPRRKQKVEKEEINAYNRVDRSSPSSLSLSDSVLMIGKSGLPGRILKLIFDEKPVVPSSYIRLAAADAVCTCAACAKNG